KGLPTSLFDEFRTSLSVRSSPAPTAGAVNSLYDPWPSLYLYVTRSFAGKKGDLGAITSKGGPPDHMRASEKELVVLKFPLEQKSMFRRQERMLRRQEQQRLAKDAKIQRRIWDPEIKMESPDHLFFGCSMALDLFRLLGRWWNIDIINLIDPFSLESWFNGLRLNNLQKLAL
ncbi:hypothetical protein Tco_0827945, partial [Tanacetum coccineum]